MERDARGYLTILLHAHLPFVREPDHERFLEEGWFYEALHECYLPLLMSFESLIREGVDFRVSVSLTPTLLSMFDDELLRSRFELKLNSLIELSEKESERLSSDAQFYETARFYRDRFVAQREFYLQRCGGDVTGAFRRLQDAGYIEILTSAATHGYLPILRHEPSAVRAQLRVAVDHYAERFGRPPEGIWLPECGYYPGLDEELAAAGLRYFIVESHGVLHGSNRPAYGVYAPTICRSGVVAFARDPECAQQVWSVKEGFPGAPDYREFYRDIGHDLPLEYIDDYIGVDGLRTDTGLKYYRVTGATDQKQPYVREQAMQQAVQHAALFLQWRQKQTEWLAPQMDRRPIIVAPYDAELFGHWWFEGPEWLSCLLRKIALDQDTLITATPSEYLADRDDSQTSTPVASSWGAGGYSQVWISHENDWIVPELLRTAYAMRRLAGAYPSPSAVECRALKQAAREALLAQASDWAFMIKNNTNAEFATERVKQHLSQFDEIAAMLDSGDLEDVTTGGDSELLRRLETLEKENNLF
ncbi:MAG: DUF1957 domain-containing protein, partial [Planctomycetes bacterium]|nr:DUF1957 domain-containing protein [Planctomycetota bacterium]